MVVPAAAPVSTQRSASELRRDPLTGMRVIFAPERGARPQDFRQTETTHWKADGCPFCAGHEEATPAASLVIADPDNPDPDAWRVRVVGNKFPAVTPIDPYEPFAPSPASPWRGASRRSEGKGYELFEARPLAGGHEVIIESPYHLSSLCQLDTDHITDLFRAYAARIRYWHTVLGIEYVSIFKNVGAAAGASLLHSHSQLIATETLPKQVQAIGDRVAQHWANTGCCLQCDILRGELSDGRRVIAKSDHFVAYCPFAGRVPYLIRVVPRVHADRFEEADDAVLADLAQLTHRLVGWLERIQQPSAYNYTLHTRPPSSTDDESFHWWMELFPRMTTFAGFEWASDCFINPLMPETAAAHFRELARRDDPLQQRMTPHDFSR
jgi:UDPglucose--hexose-1-phosphate uridylyltransferase